MIAALIRFSLVQRLMLLLAASCAHRRRPVGL